MEDHQVAAETRRKFDIWQGSSQWLQETWKTVKKQKYLQLMMLLPVLYYIIFQYVPMYGIIIAFKDFSIRKGIWGSEWIGFDHFIRFFTNPYFFTLLKNTFLLSVFSWLWTFPAPIFLALVLNEVKSAFFKRFVQTVSYLPHFISTVAVVGMLTLFLSPQQGLVNQILQSFGIEPIYFLIRPQWFRTIYIGSSVWSEIGWGSIVYLAAISNVDQTMYEASTIDGANRFQNIWYITLPSISHTIVILLILSVGKLLSVGFEKVFLLYNPQTYEVADVISTYVYRRGLQAADYAYGTAVGLSNSVVNLLLIWFANTMAKKTNQSSLW